MNQVKVVKKAVWVAVLLVVAGVWISECAAQRVSRRAQRLVRPAAPATFPVPASGQASQGLPVPVPAPIPADAPTPKPMKPAPVKVSPEVKDLSDQLAQELTAPVEVEAPEIDVQPTVEDFPAPEPTTVEAAESEELPTTVEAAEAAEDEFEREISPAAGDATLREPTLRMVTDAELAEALKLPESATVEELFAFIESTGTLRPAMLDGSDAAVQEAQVKAFLGQVYVARLAAADRILESPELSKEAREQAISVKVKTLLTLTQVDAQYEAQLYTLADELRAGDDPALAWSLDGILIQYELSKESQVPTPEKYREHVGRMLAHLEKGIEGECLDMSFAGTTVQLLALVGELLPSEEAQAQLRAGVEALRKSKDQQLLEVADALEGMARGMGLVGKPLEITLHTFDGKEIHTADYAGKTLLLMFWSAMDQTSLQELPVVMQLYEFYHEKGFEVVGITMDEDSAELREVLTSVDFPWPTVVDSPAPEQDAEAGAEAGAEPAPRPAPPSSFLGIVNLPTKVLVDAEGKVVSMDADFNALMDVLENAYGELPAPAPQEGDTPEEVETPEDVEVSEELVLPEDLELDDVLEME